jgi:DNA gyrase subunit A
MIVREGYEVMLISQDGTVIRTSAEGISRMGRSTQGVRLMNLRSGDKVSAIARVTEPPPAATQEAPSDSGQSPDGAGPQELDGSADTESE